MRSNTTHAGDLPGGNTHRPSADCLFGAFRTGGCFRPRAHFTRRVGAGRCRRCTARARRPAGRTRRARFGGGGDGREALAASAFVRDSARARGDRLLSRVWGDGVFRRGRGRARDERDGGEGGGVPGEPQLDPEPGVQRGPARGAGPRRGPRRAGRRRQRKHGTVVVRARLLASTRAPGARAPEPPRPRRAPRKGRERPRRPRRRRRRRATSPRTSPRRTPSRATTSCSRRRAHPPTAHPPSPPRGPRPSARSDPWETPRLCASPSTGAAATGASRTARRTGPTSSPRTEGRSPSSRRSRSARRAKVRATALDKRTSPSRTPSCTCTSARGR